MDTTIKKPIGKLEKVTHLLNIASLLGILNDKMFDELMDKYENNYLIFDFMLENINCCILNKVSVDIVKDNFILLLKINKYSELSTSNIYIPFKNCEYE